LVKYWSNSGQTLGKGLTLSDLSAAPPHPGIRMLVEYWSNISIGQMLFKTGQVPVFVQAGYWLHTGQIPVQCRSHAGNARRHGDLTSI
jgi:hypothetical protein